MTDHRNARRHEYVAALPAIVALLACVMAGGFVIVRPADPDPKRLQKQAEEAFNQHDDAEAILQYQRLIVLEPDQPHHAYDLARVLDRQHQRAEALAVLSHIAPVTGGGYAPAHLQQAEWLMEAGVLGANADPQLLTAARAHLNENFTDEPSRRRAEALRFALEAGAHDPAEQLPR